MISIESRDGPVPSKDMQTVTLLRISPICMKDAQYVTEQLFKSGHICMKDVECAVTNEKYISDLCNF